MFNSRRRRKKRQLATTRIKACLISPQCCTPQYASPAAQANFVAVSCWVDTGRNFRSPVGRRLPLCSVIINLVGRALCCCMPARVVLSTFLLVSRMTSGHWCRWDWVATALLSCLLLLQICLVVQCLLLVGSHAIVWRHGCVARLHASGWCCDRGVGFFWGLDCGLAVDTIRVGWLGGIEAGLMGWSIRVKEIVLSFVSRLTWMRFLPSGLVTRGWSLGVVKV